MEKTLEQIRHEGLEALQQRLGRAGMIRFLGQFETGSGDYATQRREWVDQIDLDQIRAASAPTNRSSPSKPSKPRTS